MRKFIAGLFVATLLWFAPLVPAQAQVAPPPAGVPTYTVPAPYNLNIAIYAFDIGQGFGSRVLMTEQNTAGQWNVFYNSPNLTDMAGAVAAAGGPILFLQTQIEPGADLALAQRYPAIGTGYQPQGDTEIDPLNDALAASFKFLQSPQGVPQLGFK